MKLFNADREFFEGMYGLATFTRMGVKGYAETYTCQPPYSKNKNIIKTILFYLM